MTNTELIIRAALNVQDAYFADDADTAWECNDVLAGALAGLGPDASIPEGLVQVLQGMVELVNDLIES